MEGANVGGATSRRGSLNKQIGDRVETPVGLRKITSELWSEGSDFSGFREDKSNMRRIITVEKEVRCMRELIASILEKQDQLLEENKELKCKCDRFESVLVANREMKVSLEVIK